jgi:multidrug resistance efflux pump
MVPCFRSYAAVEQARDKLNVDSTNYARQQALWAQQIGSRNDLDQRELAYTTSRTPTIARESVGGEPREIAHGAGRGPQQRGHQQCGNDDRTRAA